MERWNDGINVSKILQLIESMVFLNNFLYNLQVE